MYSIKQVVEMLEIPSVTLRAWENRYQAVVPERTESGYRLYSREDVEDLRWLKDQTEQQGISISHAVRLLKDRKAQETRSRVSLEGDGPQDVFGKLTSQIYEALFDFQGERANALMDFGFSLYPFEEMVHHVLVPILVQVGDEWEAGRATVAQEHYMTHMISNRFYQFFHAFPVYAHLPKVLAFCPAGEHHQVGLLLFALFLRKRGAEVHYLGPNVPEEGVISMLDKHSGIGCVCLSVTDSSLRGKSEALIQRIRSLHPQLTFIVGGRAYEKPGGSSVADTVLGGQTAKWEEWYDQFLSRMSS
ncbi:MerR family transcriptional regulator [Gorillibacterium sp. CAU 1737]|uniref:MerR family transcriptional regulator n=1 Tax=Gorillibacterium sp. CAU 1737 TaxID=3140362 RepID=UPI003260456A